jgi:hypothetical protein
MEPKIKSITMRDYLKKAVDETLIAASVKNRVRMALENVPEWVTLPEDIKNECVDFVSNKIPSEI